MLFLLVCCQGPMNEFRFPELESIASLHGFEIKYHDENQGPNRPFLVIDLPSEKEAKILGSRLIGFSSIWRFWAMGTTYEEVHAELRRVEYLWKPLAISRSVTWKFTVTAHGRHLPKEYKTQVIEKFSWTDFLGDIALKDPDVEVGVLEEYDLNILNQNASEGQGIKAIWIGSKLCDTQRFMINQFDVKKRAYIGNTTMEAEASLLMANQAHAAPGKFLYDPFAGTGSMLLTCAAFGATTFGSDIDGRQMRGKGKGRTILDSAKQYGIQQRLLATASFDMTQHPFRTGEVFDAIITDPPYGVRAGAKRLGRKPEARLREPTLVPGREEEIYHHQLPDYVPPSVPWEMEEVITSLITFSLYMLKPGGRLVFFLPTETAGYSDDDIPVVPGLKLIANSLQDYGKWGRRLITMEKALNFNEAEGGSQVIQGLDRGVLREGQIDWFRQEKEKLADSVAEKKLGHSNFREKFFNQFEKIETSVAGLNLNDKS